MAEQGYLLAVQLPDTFATGRRLVRLAEMEDEARNEQLWEVVDRIRAKREAILTELDDCLRNSLGKLRCPLCDPTLLEEYPLRLLRQCAHHSLPLLLFFGRMTPPSDTTGSGNTSKRTRQSSRETKTSGERRATSYERWKQFLTAPANTTQNGKPIR